MFWACGVTPQSVVATVKPEFCITHYPGSMLVTDRRNTEFAIMSFRMADSDRASSIATSFHPFGSAFGIGSSRTTQPSSPGLAAGYFASTSGSWPGTTWSAKLASFLSVS